MGLLPIERIVCKEGEEGQCVPHSTLNVVEGIPCGTGQCISPTESNFKRFPDEATRAQRGFNIAKGWLC